MESRIIRYRQFGKCLYLSNGIVEAIVTLEFGPRIIRFCLCGRENLFYEQPEEADYLTTPEGWRIYGGHRLLWAPESEKTYWPDNAPVGWEPVPGGVRLTQEADGFLNVQKSMELRLSVDGPAAELWHGVRNVGKTPLAGAPWAVSAVRAGGILSVPFGPGEACPSPGRFVSLWGSTALSDSRLRFDPEGVTVRQTPTDDYFKIGLWCEGGYASYLADGQRFTKYFDARTGAAYPDNNVNFEAYACRHMMEVETLAPLGTLLPGETAEHRERWEIAAA